MKSACVWVVLACVAAGLCGCAGGGGVPPADHPALRGEMPERLRAVRDQVPDEVSPFVLVVKLNVKPEARAEFERLAAAATAGTRREPGNRAYTFIYEAGDPGAVLLYEEWRSFRDLRLHFDAEHMKPFFAGIGAMLDGPPDLRVYRAL
jgi:quinol monooxygenase YgiN